MKSRERTKRVRIVIKKSEAWSSSTSQLRRHRTAKPISPFNVKKEEEDDQKIAFNTPRAILGENIAARDSTTAQAKSEIKQEDMDTKVALHATREYSSNTLGHNYHCKSCNLFFKSLRTVLDHQKSVHNQRRCNIKHIDLQPDIDDPNHYCKSCQVSYKTENVYRAHLRITHHMVLASKRRRPKIDITPDPEDPNHYCRSCQRFYKNKKMYQIHLKTIHTPTKNLHCISCDQTYSSRASYISHLIAVHQAVGFPDLDDMNNYCNVCESTYKNKERYQSHCKKIHGLQPVKFVNPDAVPDINDPDNYCKTCDKRFTEKERFKLHLHFKHKIPYKLSPPRHCNKQPDINNPNNHCCCCDKTLSSKASYKRHLFLVHSIPQQAPRIDQPLPDVDDPNFYCRVCQKNYESRSLYRRHLRYVHQMILAPLTLSRIRSTLLSNLPNLHDPNNYCSVCDVTIKSRGKYREHCRYNHLMESGRPSIKNSNAVIDINSPDLYCAQCERSYSRKRIFIIHLKDVHSINVDTFE